MGLIASYRAMKRRADHANALYLAMVEQSRVPRFYTELGVPDTVDGRFDMIILHVMLVIRRLREEGEEAAGISQELLNLLFADMDRNLREMGVGDMSIGKHVKKAAKAFYGRAETLESGLDAGSAELMTSLRATIYRSVERADDHATILAGYVAAADRHLKNQPIAGFLAGKIDFYRAPVQSPADLTG